MPSLPCASPATRKAKRIPGRISAMSLDSAKGHIFQKKKGGPWYICYWAHGKRKYKKAGRSKEIARALLIRTQEEIARGQYLSIEDLKPISFAELCEKYLESYSKVNKAPRSQKRDAQIIKALSGHFTGVVATIEYATVERYKAWRLGQGVRPTTINKELATLKHIFGQAILWGYLRENPAAKAKRLRPGPESRHEIVLRTEEVEKLLSHCNPFLRRVVVCAIHAGMRKEEILSLRKESESGEQPPNRANPDARTITLTSTKSGETRTVYINDTLLETLQKVEPLRGGYFFPSSKQTRYANITKVFNTAVKNAGIRKIRFHDLRHTFKTLLLDDGANPLAVEKLMGHKLPAMLERYWHPNPTLLLETVKRLDRMLDQQPAMMQSTPAVLERRGR